MRTRFDASWIAVLVLACAACTRQSPPAAPPPQEPQVVKADFYVEAEDPPPGEPGMAPVTPTDSKHRDQPPEVKLALGHFYSKPRGIGAVVDCTAKEAKLRYDGTDNIIKLYGERGPYGRTDYHKNASSVLLEVHEDGHVVVYLPQAPNGIEMYRDADADPL